MDNLISIIVPIYNIEPYLSKCIDSIINQTYKNIEIILVDDGSTDNSGKICDEYAKRENRIIVIHQDNKGLVSARKAGLAISKGEYIGFVDGDDWIEPEMYKHLLDILLESNADFVDSGYIKDFIDNCIQKVPNRCLSQTIFLDENIRKDIIYSLICNKYNSDNYILPNVWSKLIKCDLLKKSINFVDNNVSYGEDFICTLYLIQYANIISYTDKYYYHYTIRPGSITQEKNINSIISQLMYMLHSLYDFLDNFSYQQGYKNASNYITLSELMRYSNDLKCNLFKNYPCYKYKNDKLLKNKKIIIYGAGDIGKSYYIYYSRKQDIDVICWVDAMYEKLNKDNTLYIIKSPDYISECVFDYLIIAVKHQSLANDIKRNLMCKGLHEEKILWSEPQNTLDWLL